MSFKFLYKVELKEDGEKIYIPATDGIVQAGFPSPAADYVQQNICLDDILIKNPHATYLGRVGGESLRDYGIFSGDWLLVDRSLEPLHDNIVIALVDGEYTAKQLDLRGKRPVLKAHNPDFPDIHLKDESELLIAGVVRNSIRSFL